MLTGEDLCVANSHFAVVAGGGIRSNATVFVAADLYFLFIQHVPTFSCFKVTPLYFYCSCVYCQF